MVKQHVFAAVALLGSVALAPGVPTVGVVSRATANAQAAPPAAASVAPPSDSLKVVLLGTGAGPVVNLHQYGASILVEAGGQRLLFDCGRGATMRLAQAGVPIGSISRVFLTHLHSDHVLQLPDLLLVGWAVGRRAGPLTVWGPVGTRAMMNHLLQAFDFDIRTRRDVDEHFPADGIKVVSHDIRGDGVVLDENGLTVTAFLVDHGLVRPAFGYRVDYRGRSVVLSGDTRVSENLIRHARGVDVLIHETIDAEALRTRPDRPSPATIDAIIAHHTTPEQAGTVFRRVAPRLAVYSHAPNNARVMALTRTTYTGPLQGAEDLLTIFIGAEVRVEHHAPIESSASRLVGRGHAGFDLTGAWATGSESEPAVERIVRHVECNYTPALWTIQQNGDTVRAWTMPASEAKGVATPRPVSTVPALGLISGVDVTIGTGSTRYVLRYDSTSGHLRGTLNGAPFWAVRQEIVRPEHCIPVP